MSLLSRRCTIPPSSYVTVLFSLYTSCHYLLLFPSKVWDSFFTSPTRTPPLHSYLIPNLALSYFRLQFIASSLPLSLTCFPDHSLMLSSSALFVQLFYALFLHISNGHCRWFLFRSQNARVGEQYERGRKRNFITEISLILSKKVKRSSRGRTTSLPLPSNTLLALSDFSIVAKPHN